MIDLFNLPAPQSADIQIFNVPYSIAPPVWRKPRGCTMAYLFALGGGGGGGGGAQAASGNRGGGGGGGSSAQCSLTVPIWLLPDTLFIYVGAGGAGGAVNAAGGGGAMSYVSMKPDVSAFVNVVLRAGSVTATGGGFGSGTGVGSAGAAGTATAVTQMIFGSLGHFIPLIGQAGTAGGAIAGGNGSAVTLPTNGAVTTGGTGGAGTNSADFAGGGYNSVGDTLVSEIRPIGASGSCGFTCWKPFYNFGGRGGASDPAGPGGTGGFAAYGSGGGGGGAGTTGGVGGKGGDGLIIIACW